MKAFHRTLPLRGRVALLIGLFGFAAGAALMSYQFYRRPAVLTLAVGLAGHRVPRGPGGGSDGIAEDLSPDPEHRQL